MTDTLADVTTRQQFACGHWVAASVLLTVAGG